VDCSETAIVFECDGDALVGVVSAPAQAGPTGVVVVVGGPQTRVGSHRHFVQVTRSLAAAGFQTLRFDYRGMGDSSGAQRNFEQVDDDIGAAIRALQRQVPETRQVVLWGLCDGASAALLYLHATGDPRVRGLCLLNPWVRSEASLARTHVKHYYLQRLMQRGFWLKLLRGQVALGAARGLARNIGMVRSKGGPLASFQQRMAGALDRFPGPVLLLLSEDDYTAKEFVEYTRNDAEWTALLSRPRVQRHELAGADHTLSAAPAKALAQTIIEGWLRAEFPSAAGRETLETGHEPHPR
jgi:exosortase A-associated hydrolase 1